MDFIESHNLFLKFIDKIPWHKFSKYSHSAQKVGVVVIPWLFTQVPWYSMTLAFLYLQRGCNVCFIWDDLIFNDEQGTKQQNFYINNILERLKDHIPAFRLSQSPILPITTEEKDQMQKLALANAIWLTRSSVPSNELEYFSNQFVKNLKRNLPHIYGLFDSINFEHIVVPGGIYGNSGLFVKAAKKAGIRVATYDSGFGSVLIGTDNVAAYQMDIPKLFEPDSIFLNPDVKQKAISSAHNEFHLRKEGKEGRDNIKYQTHSYSQSDRRLQFDVLIPLNIEWDAGQLDKHRFFKSDSEWIFETLHFLLNNTGATIAVRQHPGDRFCGFTGKRLESYLTDQFGKNVRFKLISCDEPVNTYKLIESSKVVLPSTSTIGIEAAMLGKVVVIETDVYYASLPFVTKSISKTDYFSKIKNALSGQLQIGPQERELASLCYYFTFNNFIYTDFTPQPADFAKWVKRDFDDLLRDKNVNIIIDSVSKALPVPLLNSEEAFQDLRLSEEIERLKKSSNQKSQEITNVLKDNKQQINIDQKLQNTHIHEVHSLNVTFGSMVQVIGVKNIQIGEGSCIGDNVWLNVCLRDDKIRMIIGKCVLVGRQSMISTGGYLEIGDYCVLAPRVYVSDADHVFADIYQPILQQGATLGRSVIVEENCWLGINVVVAGNLTVGRCSIIAANAVVTKDIPPFSIVAGVPAKIIKMYNPATKEWEQIKDKSHIEQILKIRETAGIPGREEYKRILEKNAQIRHIDAIVAGKGITI